MGFYEYRTSQVIKLSAALGAETQRRNKIFAELTLRVSKDKSLANAEVRAATIEIQPELCEVDEEIAYLRLVLAGHEERRKVQSKIMERIYRELMIRSEARAQSGSGTPSPPRFRRIARN